MNCDVRVAVHVVGILNSLMSFQGHHIQRRWNDLVFGMAIQFKQY